MSLVVTQLHTSTRSLGCILLRTSSGISWSAMRPADPFGRLRFDGDALLPLLPSISLPFPSKTTETFAAGGPSCRRLGAGGGGRGGVCGGFWLASTTAVTALSSCAGAAAGCDLGCCSCGKGGCWAVPAVSSRCVCAAAGAPGCCVAVFCRVCAARRASERLTLAGERLFFFVAAAASPVTGIYNQLPTIGLCYHSLV